MTPLREALQSGVERLRRSGSESARLDAELLLGHVLGIDRSAVLAHPGAPVGPDQLARFDELLDRRAGGEPVAYIRGIKEFYGHALSVDRRALIPRPETETLVELALRRIGERLTERPRPPGTPPLRVIDVGTGGGAICVTLAVVLRRTGAASAVVLAASDRSAEALELAVENAVAHGVADRIVFRECDLVPVDLVDAGRFDLLVANLPYLPSDLLPRLPVAASFEPTEALDGGPDGLAAIRGLLLELPAALAPNGGALLEIGSDQVDALGEAVARTLPGWRLNVHPDLGGRPRVAELTPPAAA